MRPLCASLDEPVGLLQALDPKTLAWVTPRLRVASIPAGSLVYSAGDPVEGLYVIRQGRVRVVRSCGDRSLPLAELGPGDCFGEMSLLEGRVRRSTVEAITPVEALVLDEGLLTELLDDASPGAAALHRALLRRATERLRAVNDQVARLLEQTRREQELVALLVHDLRSPLSVADCALRRLVDRQEQLGPLTSRQTRLLERASRSVRFGVRLAEEVLEVGRKEAGRTRLSSVTAGALLEEAVSHAAGAAKVVIEADAELLERPLMVDRMRLVQLLMNLIGNAAKYSREEIRVEVAELEGQLIVAVRDRGPGIPEGYRERVFERYQQASAKRDGIPRGFGYGLAGAKQLVEGLGGWIEVCESGPESGTTIRFAVPWLSLAGTAGKTRS